MPQPARSTQHRFFFQSVKQHHLSWQAHCAHLWLMLALTKPLPRTNIKNNCTSEPFLSDKHMRKLSWHKHLHQFFFFFLPAWFMFVWMYVRVSVLCIMYILWMHTRQPGVSFLEIWSMEGGQAGRDLCAWPGLAKCRPSHQEEKLPSVLENQICEKQIELPCDKELQQMARQMIEHEQRFCFCFCLCQLESRTKWHGTVTDLSVAASSEWVIYYAAILSNCG